MFFATIDRPEPGSDNMSLSVNVWDSDSESLMWSGELNATEEDLNEHGDPVLWDADLMIRQAGFSPADWEDASAAQSLTVLSCEVEKEK